jgi:hypothetical protein
MPGTTERAKALHALSRARKRILTEAVDSGTDEVDDEMEENLQLTMAIQSRRHMKRPSKYRNKGFDADRSFQDWLTDGRYQTFTHMNRESFLSPPLPPLPPLLPSFRTLI